MSWSRDRLYHGEDDAKALLYEDRATLFEQTRQEARKAQDRRKAKELRASSATSPAR